ncbi:MAG TPA: S41 family peptidase [Candidatus Polarisedimenticolaceae bacterium]|nr:S41 family peptidase [Candidatus Polarisedimenticolaceae bacterium]
MRRSLLACIGLVLALPVPAARAEGVLGYYREPALHGGTLVFVAEGDLWVVPLEGGAARRLTSHPGEEGTPAISPDGTTVAFTAEYEGPREVYTMPLQGGLPSRWTFEGEGAAVVGWTPSGEVLFATTGYSTLPSTQLVRLTVEGPQAGRRHLVPLAQAADGSFDDTGRTLFFTRLPFQGSHTKRYRGGTAQNVWRFAEGDGEATPLSADWPGTTSHPLWWRGRVLVVTDRDGTKNLWSMAPDGSDRRQLTRHRGWDVASPTVSEGKVVYQLGADLHVLDLAGGQDRQIPIVLPTDLDQAREHWVDKPMDWVTAFHPSPDGTKVVLTARGKVFAAPHRQGRLVQVTREDGVRWREARFLDAKSVLALSDASGEVEVWQLPANGVGEAKRLTKGSTVLRWEAVPSPDGRRVAHHDKDQRLFVLDVASGEDRRIDASTVGGFDDLAWSPDGRFLAYVAPAANAFRRIRIWSADDGKIHDLTSDRFESYAPAFGPDGKWIYFLSDRNLVSAVPSPWGSYAPEPFFAKATKVYHVPLTPGLRSPWAPADELHAAEEKKEEEKKEDAKDKDNKKEDKKEKQVRVVLDPAGLLERLREVPVPPGNYDALAVTDKALFFLSTAAGETKQALQGVAIARQDVKVETVLEDVSGAELSQDGKTLLVRKKDTLYLIPAEAKKADLDKKDVDLSAWRLSVQPRREWHQMFLEAWRLERDYFYDPGMHGVDWNAMREKYLPLVDRVTSRAELSDVLGQLVSELSALHIFVRGGDLRTGEDDVKPGFLGAELEPAENGWRVARLYRNDPDEPDRLAPLARPEVDVREGDVVVRIDGVETRSVLHPAMLLRGKAGAQVLLEVAPKDGGKARQVVVVPVDDRTDGDLRYSDWEYTRRLEVERLGKGDIGYVHLRAMGTADWTLWAKGFYPVFTRKGLILDARNNRGGNIDSWILGRLLRRPWHYWSQRIGQAPTWNMQQAFGGHVVVLCNERTSSDGEVLCEGIRRLGIGTVIGTRTWGGEIWLTSSNVLVDRGIATAAEFGVYGPQGDWLIEGHGVEPDVRVDNLPHATFQGKDAQLEAAVAFLQDKIKKEPVVVPVPIPKYPVKVEPAPEERERQN